MWIYTVITLCTKESKKAEKMFIFYFELWQHCWLVEFINVQANMLAREIKNNKSL